MRSRKPIGDIARLDWSRAKPPQVFSVNAFEQLTVAELVAKTRPRDGSGDSRYQMMWWNERQERYHTGNTPSWQDIPGLSLHFRAIFSAQLEERPDREYTAKALTFLWRGFKNSHQ